MAWEPMRLSDAIGSDNFLHCNHMGIWVTDMSEARLLADHMHLPPVVPFPCPMCCFCVVNFRPLLRLPTLPSLTWPPEGSYATLRPSTVSAPPAGQDKLVGRRLSERYCWYGPYKQLPPRMYHPAQELRAPPREWSGWAPTIVHPRRKLFIWTVPTISLTETPPHELILARWRGGDQVRQWHPVRQAEVSHATLRHVRDRYPVSIPDNVVFTSVPGPWLTSG